MALIDTLEKEKTEGSDIIDIQIPEIRKKRFRIDGDNNRILELDTSDMSIITRLDNVYDKLNDLTEDAAKALAEPVEGESDEDVIKKTSAVLKRIDNKMRKLIDNLFDANVSEVCAPTGSMYDLYDGKYRFEHILEILFKLYEENITGEFDKLKKRVSKRTEKYVKK